MKLAMFRLLLHLCFIFTFAICSSAQDFSLTWSDINEGVGKSNISNLLVEGSSIFVMAREGTLVSAGVSYPKPNEYLLKTFDPQLKQTCATPLSAPATLSSMEPKIISIFARDGVLRTTLYLYDKAKKTSYYNLLGFDACKLQPEVVDFTALCKSAGLDPANCDFIETNRSDRFVFYVSEPYVKGATMQTNGYILFDKDFNVLFSGKVSFPSKATFSLSQAIVNDADGLYLIGTDVSAKGHAVVILNCLKGSEPKQSGFTESGINIRLEDEYHLLSDGTLGWAGFYDTKGAGSEPGIFFRKLNPETGAMAMNKLIKFSEVKNPLFKLTSFQGDRIDLVQQFWKKDGSVIIIGEEKRSVTNNTGTNSFFKDICAFSISLEGNLQWTAVIPKEQMLDAGESQQYHFASFGAVLSEEKLCFVFNANPADTETQGKILKRMESSQTVMAAVDVKSGVVKRTPLFVNDDGMVTIAKMTAQGTRPGEIIIIRANKHEKPTDTAKLKFILGKAQLN